MSTKKAKKSTRQIGVREFAIPLKRHGGLGSSPLSSLPLDLGQEIHERIQLRLTAEGGYEAEFPLKMDLAGASYDLKIRGRCDGYFPGDEPLLEEIKSSFGIASLLQALDTASDHPYLLQIQCYGYMFFLREGICPRLRLRLVDTRTLVEKLRDVSFDPEAFGAWVKSRQLQIEGDLLRYAALLKTRKKLAPKLFFPFASKRAQQDELMEQVSTSLAAGHHLLLQAPTGLGKTAAVLLPALREGLAAGRPVLYLAPKNSQFQAAVDLAGIFQKQRVSLKVLVLTSKAKACRQDEVNCQESACAYSALYFDKVDALALHRRDRKKQLWDNRYFQKMADLHEVCPYELGMERIREADLIIGDYNYVFSPRANFFDRYLDPILPMLPPILVVDEAHNLHERVMENFSPTIRLSLLKGFLQTARDLADRPLADLIEQGLDLMQAMNPRLPQAKIEADKDGVSDLLQRCLTLITARWGREGLPTAGDPLFEFFTQWHDLNEMLDFSRENVPLIYKRDEGDEILRAQCIDPSPFSAELTSNFFAVVAFSATLKPFDFYRSMMGLNPERTDMREFSSPFPREHKKILIIPQVQTNYRERERHYARIADVIGRVVALKPGPYLVFFPSYHFLRAVQAELPDPAQVFAQSTAMAGEQIRDLRRMLQDRESPRLILAVQGGSLSEGIDFRGEGLQGVFIVGPAVPQASFERQLMQEHFEKKYGRGRSFAYVYPSMTRSVQAAGRIVRDESERGVIVLMDPRFLEKDYAEAMPADWFHESPRELVPQHILAELSAFWGPGAP